MYNKRFASLVLACFVSVSFCLPAVLADEISPEDIVAEEIEILDFETTCGMDVKLSEVGLTMDPPVPYSTTRAYTIKIMNEEFEGATFIMTAMDDQSADCITFRVKVPVIVWATSDKRHEGQIAARLTEQDGWTLQSDGTLADPDKGIVIETVEGDTNIFVVRSKAFSAGEITLGTYGIGGPIILTLDPNAAVEATGKLSTTWAGLKSK